MNERLPTAEIEPGAPTEEIEAPIYREPQVQNIVEALGSLEAGEDLEREAVTMAIFKDLGIEASLEDHKRPDNYSFSKGAKLFEDIKGELEEAMSGPVTYVEEVVEQRGIVDRLRKDRAKAFANEDRAKADTIYSQIKEQERKLSQKEQKLRIIAESEETLAVSTEEERSALMERLDRKRDQAERLRKAINETETLANYYYFFVEAAFDDSQLQKLSIDPRYGRFTSSGMSALTGLPGIKPALDLAMDVFLQYNRGEEAKIDGESVIPGRNVNLCADPEGIRPDNRRTFKKALESSIANKLSEAGIPYQHFFASRGVELAMALHDSYFISLVHPFPRDEHMSPLEDDPEEGAGSMHGIIPIGTDKVTNMRKKMMKDALAGYPAPMTLAIKEVVDRLITDGFHGVSVELKSLDLSEEELNRLGLTEDERRILREGAGEDDDEVKKDIYTLLINTGIGMSEIFEVCPEAHHTGYLLGPFNAFKIWNLMKEIPREQIKLVPDAEDVAYQSIRRIAPWMADIHKRLDKALARIYDDSDRAKAESTRMLMNIAIASWRKMIERDVVDGGDFENREKDLTGKTRTYIKEYLYDYLVEEFAVLTPFQYEILMQLAENKQVILLSEAALDSDTELVEILSQRVKDDEVKERRVARKILFNQDMSSPEMLQQIKYAKQRAERQYRSGKRFSGR